MPFLTLFLLTFISSSASAQVWIDPAYRGSGHRAGGPAYVLNYGGYAGPGLGYAGPPRFYDPAYRGSGQRAGGPAYLLNPSYGLPSSYYRPGWYGRSPAYRGSGQRAGGPAYLLNPY